MALARAAIKSPALRGGAGRSAVAAGRYRGSRPQHRAIGGLAVFARPPPRAKLHPRSRRARRRHCERSVHDASPGHGDRSGRSLCRPRRALAAAHARGDAAGSSLPRLGALRRPGPVLELRRVSRQGRRARRGPRPPRHPSGRLRAHPPRQLHRGAARLVCARRARRGGGDDQYPLGGRGGRLFRRTFAGGRGHHPAGLCRARRLGLPGTALDRGHRP